MKETLEEILKIIHSIKEDNEKLEILHDFLVNEFMEDIDLEEEELIIPEKLKALVNSIAQSIDMGMICHLNTDTLEMIEIPKELEYAYSEEEIEELYGETFRKVEAIENKIEFEPLYSSEGYRIMELFADKMESTKFQNQLYKALSRKGPFANFNNLVQNSEYREKWFDFKINYLEQLVAKEMKQLGIF
jgi:hypothetical protein